MKRFIRCLVFSGSVLLTIASASQGGEVGRVIGRIIPPSPGVTGPIHVVSLVNDHVRMDGEVEKDGSFLIAFVPPGRYLVVVERGFLVLSELEVVPDLTTSLAIPFNDYYNSIYYTKMINTKFGHKVMDDIKNMTSIKLERNG